MAQIALKKTTQEIKELLPGAAEVLERNTYMDDICDSVNTTEEATKLTEDIDKVFKSGGFKDKDWILNKELKDTENKETAREKPICFEEQIAEKVLGIAWNNKTDETYFEVKSDLLDAIVKEGSDIASAMMTKRVLLSQTARIYGPIGLAAAFIVRAKIGMQELCQVGVDWDEELPIAIQVKWIKLLKEMIELNNIKFQ